MATVVRGIGVSPGVAVGRAVLFRQPGEPIVPESVPPERLDAEIARFEEARGVARTEIEELRDRTRDELGANYAAILDAQLLILDDPELHDETIQRIKVGRVSAAWSLKEVVQGFLRKFEAIDDGYLRERSGDLQDVHHRLQRVLRGEPAARAWPAGEGPWIVVAHSLGPSDSIALTRHGIAGFVTDVGSRTSHTAILAQALEVPAVVGLHDITQRVASDQTLVLDGEGTVLLDPDEDDLERARGLQDVAREAAAADAAERDVQVATADGTEVRLLANVEFPNEVDTAARVGARGIGLYRTEFLFLTHSPELPSEEDHYRTYREMAGKMAPHPVTIRTLDLGGEKYFHDVLDAEETNPVLGLRAVRFCLRRPEILRPQLRAILRVAAEFPIRIMIPLVTFANEIRAVRALLAEEATALAREGIAANPDVPFGIMIEVPAAALAADLLAREVDFFSIGTNDLIQYALAVDRANESVSYLYQPFHPAVLRMLQFVVRAGERAGIPVALCGEMAGDPALQGLLIGLGLRELSVQPRSVPAVRRAIATLDVEVERARVQEAMDKGTAEEIEALFRDDSEIAANSR